jgi:hypothetical protein
MGAVNKSVCEWVWVEMVYPEIASHARVLLQATNERENRKTERMNPLDLFKNVRAPGSAIVR